MEHNRCSIVVTKAESTCRSKTSAPIETGNVWMEIVLHFHSLCTCWEPLWLPATRVRSHTYVQVQSTPFPANPLPTSIPFPTSCCNACEEREKGVLLEIGCNLHGARCSQLVGLGSVSYTQTQFFKPDVYKAISKSQNRFWKLVQRLSYRQRNAVREWAVSSYTFLVSIHTTGFLPKVTQAKGRMIERGCLKQNKQKCLMCNVFGHCSLYRILIYCSITLFQSNYQGLNF